MTTPPRRVLRALAVLCALGAPATGLDAGGKTLYDHGDPTAEEQLLLELVNRARADPAAEGERIFQDYGSPAVAGLVNAFEAAVPQSFTRTENRDAWAQYAPRPPLAFNAALIRVSRKYSETMRARDLAAQTFEGVPGLLSRVAASGYDPFWLGQLVQGYTPDVLSTHASWTIDWGQPAIGGARPDTPNRRAVINPADVDFLRFLEAGVGIVRRPNPPPGGVGPLVTTLTLGTRRDPSHRFVTGVVFDDRDGDGSYDVGEGLGGVRIDVEGGTWYAITSSSGGYAVPVPALTGQVTVTAAGVPGKPSEVFRRQEATGSTFAFGDPANVKIDFVVQERSDPPDETVVAGGIGDGAADGEAVFVAPVPPFDATRPTLGDLDVDVDVLHPDRSRLRLALEAPDGTTAVLWEGGPGGADLTGSFDTTLRSRDPLATFVDRPYEGLWRLHVADSAGEVPVVRSWRLRMRPRWEGPLHARAPHLFVSKLRVADRKKVGGDKLSLRAEIDVGVPLDADVASFAELILRDTEPPHRELARLPVNGPVGTSAVVLDGEVSLDVTPSVKGTSRARVKLSAKGLDLPALPRDVRLELALGDLLVSEDVRLSKGRFTGRRTAPLNGTLRVDSFRARAHVLGVRTDLRGRFLQPSLPRVPSVVEVRIGDAAGLWLDGPDAVDGNVVVYGPSGDFRRLVLDTSTGRFRARAVGQHDPEDDAGRVPLSLWVGNHYEALTLTPRRDGGGDLRY